ncbi:exopolysaccharide Pel transporter PelG [Cupriavidus sp. WGtm5]|uniref:exopolysaccharide Pel transporter PelG n=1 Tax=Cupriavidus TaxID=106589 RepID=UPI000E102EEF|nr:MULTISPECIES: exopolysaccharide Pel transporter PelG [Cupriavidus]MCO4888030.1 exopolysaccharide Pel transporter PelG [Cupriavidus sp. WGtm5]ULX52238.1 histidine kinase [Cupriavidus taiwanensis]SPA43472.1 putative TRANSMEMBRANE PROTEIN, COG4267 [Cupriavidus taiwanensis]
MAGIGFELRKMLRRDNLSGMLSAYAYAGIISSGPWILSIVGILLIGMLSLPFVVPGTLITQFQVSVTYLIAGSLILTGPMQLSFTRFTSDRLFEKRDHLILSNYHAVALLATVLSGGIGVACAVFSFGAQSVLYRLLMVAGFVVLSNIWIAAIFLSSMKQYKAIVWTFLLGYAVSVAAALGLRGYGMEGLLGGFVAGQLCLLTGMVTLIYRNYTSRQFISFEVFRRRYAYPSLVAIGLLYNLGIWIDKFMFWYAQSTGHQVIGPLRASIIYDIPVFLAYLAIIPGMAVFLVRIETDFVEYYDAFYDAVRGGSSLEHIEDMRNTMVQTIRLGLYEIVKVQAIAALLLFAVGVWVLRLLGISELYLPLLYVDVIGASLQVVLLGVLNIYFYLDRRREVLLLTALFVVLNCALTLVTLQLGPAWYGYGFAVSLLVVVALALAMLDHKLERLEYETYMLQ